MNDCLLLPMFPWTPIVQTSAANWLTRFKWKEILSNLGRESIMKKFRAVLEKSNIEVSLLMHVLGYILPWTTIFCFGCFIMFKQLFVLHFHKDAFNFVPPMFHVDIWRSHHFMRGPPFFEGATGGLGGHRWPLTKKDIPIYSEFIQGTTFGGDIDDNKEELQAPVQPMTKISFKWHFLSG